MQVNILEAKNRLSELIRTAQSGEEVVIANRGRPVARLVPVSETTVPGAGDVRVILEWLEANRLPPYARRTLEEIDAGIAEERASWD